MAGKLAAVSVGSLLLLTLVFYSPITVGAQEDDDPYGYKRGIEEAINSTGISWDTVLRADISVSTGTDFNCNTDIQKNPATSVNELTPADIKVMGALGDSVTTGFGAKANGLIGITTNYKGVSWSIGGDDDLKSYTTLPNIIRKYNPNVKGFSIKKRGLFYSADPKNNVAVSGAVASNMPDQAKKLVDLIKNDESVNVDEDWKLITLWIGGNDLCRYCNDKDNLSPDNYANHIREALIEIKKGLPHRTFINVVKILDVTKLEAVQKDGGILCDVIHLFVCACATDKNNEETRQAQKNYNAELEKMIDEPDFHTEDFTVVLQPFMENIEPPKKDNGKVDMDYFSPDCFHFSTLGHKLAAAALWNNMLERVGQKSNDWKVDPTLKCPTEEFPYFYTKENSLKFNSYGAVPNGNLQGDEETSSVNLLALLLGVGVAALVVVVVIVGGVAGAVWYKRRQNRRRTLTGGTVKCDTEKVYLIKKT